MKLLHRYLYCETGVHRWIAIEAVNEYTGMVLRHFNCKWCQKRVNSLDSYYSL